MNLKVCKIQVIILSRAPIHYAFRERKSFAAARGKKGKRKWETRLLMELAGAALPAAIEQKNGSYIYI